MYRLSVFYFYLFIHRTRGFTVEADSKNEGVTGESGIYYSIYCDVKVNTIAYTLCTVSYKVMYTQKCQKYTWSCAGGRFDCFQLKQT